VVCHPNLPEEAGSDEQSETGESIACTVTRLVFGRRCKALRKQMISARRGWPCFSHETRPHETERTLSPNSGGKISRVRSQNSVLTILGQWQAFQLRRLSILYIKNREYSNYYVSLVGSLSLGVTLCPDILRDRLHGHRSGKVLNRG
jgi:hypothetical protein